MAGNTLGDLLKAGQLDLLKQASSDNKASEKKPAKANVAKPKEKTLSSPNTSKDIHQEDYRIFHSYVRNVVQKNELYDTMFEYGDEESFSTIAELYDNPVCRDIVDYFACCFFNGEYEFLDAIANDCEQGNDMTPDEYAVVLGHKVPITYRDEYDLLSLLCSTAVSLDGRFDDESQEESVIVYDQPLLTDEDVNSLAYAAQYQLQSESRSVKPENTKALKNAQDVVNVPKKGSQVERVKVAKQPVAPERTGVNNHPVVHVKKSARSATTRPAPISKTSKESVKKPVQSAVVKRKLSLEEQHEQKTLKLRNHLEYAYKSLGIADIVSDLYRKEKYGSINIFSLSIISLLLSMNSVSHPPLMPARNSTPTTAPPPYPALPTINPTPALIRPYTSKEPPKYSSLNFPVSSPFSKTISISSFSPSTYLIPLR